MLATAVFGAALFGAMSPPQRAAVRFHRYSAGKQPHAIPAEEVAQLEEELAAAKATAKAATRGTQAGIGGADEFHEQQRQQSVKDARILRILWNMIRYLFFYAACSLVFHPVRDKDAYRGTYLLTGSVQGSITIEKRVEALVDRKSVV